VTDTTTDPSTCPTCGGESYHHTVECFTGTTKREDEFVDAAVYAERALKTMAGLEDLYPAAAEFPMEISPRRLRSLCERIIQQAATIERLTPQVLTDRDAIAKLPEETIVRDPRGFVYEYALDYWVPVGQGTRTHTRQLLTPITVVYTPKERSL
jgi:hypothetical protein